MPVDLAARLKVKAEALDRSVHATIVLALKDYVGDGPPTGRTKEAWDMALALKDRVLEAEGAQGSGAEPQPSPPERPKIRVVTTGRVYPFGCPVPGCKYLAASPMARCPDHGRLVAPAR